MDQHLIAANLPLSIILRTLRYIFNISAARPRVRARAVLTPEAAGVKKSARGVLALILADLARREHPNLRCAPRTSPRKDKSTAHRATHSPATARKGFTSQGGVYRRACEMLKSPAGRPRQRTIFLLIKFWGGGKKAGGVFSTGIFLGCKTV